MCGAIFGAVASATLIGSTLAQGLGPQKNATAMAAEEPTRVQIATASVRANGCSDSPQSFRITIPHPERLDLNYHQEGLPAGIERGYAEKNGTTSDTNYAFADNGTLTFSLYAKGGGSRIYSPFGGGNVCVDATGANITVVIYAHYRPIIENGPKS
jgi:hypothetical protein